MVVHVRFTYVPPSGELVMTRELTEQSLRGTAEGKKLADQHKFA
jgi:hypothetical protein